jgi:glyoxylase-like metal-dependent hydrolase (beta-lactamase superfamily II)
MEVDRIDRGLWRWTAFHNEWNEPVGCTYVEGPDAVCLIDPLIPPEDEARFLAALDRDVARLRLPVRVLLTVHWHTRSARALAERYEGEIWAPARARAAVERRAGAARPFRTGDVLPGGAVALATARRSEVVFHLPDWRTLVAGDVILGAPDGRLRFCPEAWLPGGVGHDELRASLQPLLTLAVDRVLVAHGRPALDEGGRALAELLRSAPAQL